MTTRFPTLFTPYRLRDLVLPNRIISSAHGTYMPKDGLQTDQIALYRATRAAGGVGLIILETTSVHQTAIGGPRYAVAVDDTCIPGYRKLFDAIHAHGTTDGTIAPCFSSSAVRCGANQLMRRAMSLALIDEVVQS